MKKNPKSRAIEEELLSLQEKSKVCSLTIGEILSILSKKGQALVVLFLSLPFCQPIQLPGLSTPFGIAIFFIGLKVAFGNDIWLPKFILMKSVRSEILQKIITKIFWLLKKMNKWTHPRIKILFEYRCVQVLNGVVILILGVLLALPLPIPLSNMIAAWSLSFIGLGLLKDDGVFILIGYVVSLITLVYFFFAASLLAYLI